MMPSESAEFVLAGVRRDFYANVDAKRFFQDRSMLMRAITQPAQWLKKRGARLPGSKYRAILATVIDTIKRHGAREKGYFPRYFLFCVQEHMKHHGDEYLAQAKTLDGKRNIGPRAINELVTGALKGTTPGGVDLTVDVLAEAHRALITRGGRIRKAEKAESGFDLFPDCKPVAKRTR
jgi:hypothetical protein